MDASLRNKGSKEGRRDCDGVMDGFPSGVFANLELIYLLGQPDSGDQGQVRV
jgi:hypothetical protein